MNTITILAKTLQNHNPTIIGPRSLRIHTQTPTQTPTQTHLYLTHDQPNTIHLITHTPTTHHTTNITRTTLQLADPDLIPKLKQWLTTHHTSPSDKPN